MKKLNGKDINWIKIIFWVTVIVIAVLWHFGLLEPLKTYLNSKELKFKIGKLSFTPFIILKSLVIFIVLLWISNKVSNRLEKVLSKTKHVSSNNRALVSKISSIVLYFVSFLIVLSILGIDISSITVLGGAIGIGIGFGLQKIASNFISGLILLFEKSISEGDLVELTGGGHGFVKRTTGRYTLIETYDGKEVMIPNEDFITSRVTNWTYSSKLGRIDLAIGVSFDSDPHKAKEIILNAAKNHRLCSTKKPPEVFLLEFGESSLNFKLLMWLDDITEGKYTATNDILFEIWDKFKENDIKIPYPNTEVHFTNALEIKNNN